MWRLRQYILKVEHSDAQRYKRYRAQRAWRRTGAVFGRRPDSYSYFIFKDAKYCWLDASGLSMPSQTDMLPQFYLKSSGNPVSNFTLSSATLPEYP